MFVDGFEQSTILRTGPDGLTRVTTRSSWAKRESVLVEARGSRAGGVPARRLVGPFRERTGVRVDLSDAQTAQGEVSSPFWSASTRRHGHARSRREVQQVVEYRLMLQ